MMIHPQESNCPSHRELIVTHISIPPLKKGGWGDWNRVTIQQEITGNYPFDFYCPKANLIIELDGGQQNCPKSPFGKGGLDLWVMLNIQGEGVFWTSYESIIA
ncbi:MAG: DUF559 domain-containing protein [Candidatus Latescibacteria bacterium]|nr:DUF559 domain-containing protein [Candidatus Latescibacterota bacterium]